MQKKQEQFSVFCQVTQALQENSVKSFSVTDQ